MERAKKPLVLVATLFLAFGAIGCGSKPEPDPVLNQPAGSAPAVYEAPKDRAGNPATSKAAPKAPDVYVPTDRNGQPTAR